MKRKLLLLLASGAFLVLAAGLRADTGEADNFYRARRYREAIAAYRAAVENLPPAEQARVYNRLGFSHERLPGREREAAIEYHRRALAIPEAAPAEKSYALLRIGYNLQGSDREEALRHYALVETVPGVPPSHVSEARLRAGWTAREIRSFPEREALFRSVLEVEDGDPDHKASALQSLGTLYEQQGESEKAITSYEAIADLEDAGERRRRAARYLAREIRAERDAPPAFYIEPYALFPEPEAATIQWVSRLPVTGNGSGQLPGTALPPVEAETVALGGQAAGHRLHRVRFEGLEPGTAYRYEIRCAGETRAGAFRTASPPGGPVVFSLYGDTQNQGYMHEPVVRQMVRDQPHFVIHAGDLVDTGSRWRDWKHQLFDPGRAMFAAINFAPTRGNHDGGPYFRPLFARAEHDYYAFQSGDARFYILASYGPDSRGTGREEQAAWLRADLAANPARWRIAVFHHPVFTPTARGGWGRDSLVPILAAHDFDLVLVGHHHTYRRLRPVGRREGQPFIHLTAGSAGGGTSDPGQSPLLVAGRSGFLHTTFRLEGDRLTAASRDHQGDTFDTFSIEKDADGRWPAELRAGAATLAEAIEINTFYHEFAIQPLTARVEAGEEAEEPAVVFTPFFQDLSGEAYLHVQSASAPDGPIPRQRVPLAGTVRLRASGLSPGRLEQPLDIEIRLEYNGVSYEPGRFRLVPEQ